MSDAKERKLHLRYNRIHAVTFCFELCCFCAIGAYYHADAAWMFLKAGLVIYFSAGFIALLFKHPPQEKESKTQPVK